MSEPTPIAQPAGFAASEPKPAATVILVRPGASAPLEAFLQMRHEKMTFMPNVLVFPGGRMDKADATPELLTRTRGVGHLSATGGGLVVAAIRETFEESGVLLARRPGSATLIAPERAAALEPRRADLNSKALTFTDFIASEDLELAGDLVLPFSRWVTPWWSRQRYDTHFFVVAAPADQVPAHDGGEAVESVWLPITKDRIADAVAHKQLKPPTMRSLERLRTLGTLDAILEVDSTRTFEHPIVPWMERRGDDFILLHKMTPDAEPEAQKIRNLASHGFTKELAQAIGADPAKYGWPD